MTVHGSGRVVIFRTHFELDVVVFHPYVSFFCSDCPVFTTTYPLAAVVHLLTHTPASSDPLKITLNIVCSECLEPIDDKDDHDHDINVSPVDLRESLLDYVCDQGRYGSLLNFRINMNAPCLRNSCCTSHSSISQIHHHACPFSSRWY